LLVFLAHAIEQLDLAAEHISKGDPNNARFGIMLTDNVLELALHQMAKDEQRERTGFMSREKTYADESGLRAALGRHFDAKVSFFRSHNKLSAEEAESIIICHNYRNEVYHIGLHHQDILPALARFYFYLVCGVFSRYRTNTMSYGRSMVLPERAQKYLNSKPISFLVFDEFQSGCLTLQEDISFEARNLVSSLADHITEIIEQQDIGVEMIATGGPRQTTRDEAIVDSQAWRLAFKEEGKKFAAGKWSGGSVLDYVNWVGANYPFNNRRDPIPSWRKREQSLRMEKNPHKALKKYKDFMTQTEDIREVIEESHLQVEMYIDEQIDRMRGK
jgi:hypothetical protein